MYNGKKVAALIAAAGNGNRFAVEMTQQGRFFLCPKQFEHVGSEPMYLCAARPFARHKAVDEIIFIFPEGYSVPEDIDIEKPFACVIGGDTRQASVRNGIAAVSFAGGLALIHDAARPFVTGSVIDGVLAAAERSGAAVPCVPVTDTLYEVDAQNGAGDLPTICRIPNRERFVAAQTPQGFDLAMIREAHKKAALDSNNNFGATDDASIAMRYEDIRVEVVPGDPINKKITYFADMPEASALPDAYRVGTGFDAHELAPGRKLIIGGVELPFEKGLLGHSDADVLTHALMDALLGAIALGDIGKLFPDTDERYRGISSLELLAQVVEIIRERGWRVENADLTVVAERPKITPYRERITASLAEILGVESSRVSVKATTTEGLGFTGREEGIVAQAVVLLYNNK
jgi:2-C-methyl-D-erythritol 2,4-cyclodiphosphate synthase/2-C-methyl-D-erythritol 4-phosphate cytidylyltransferase